MKLCGSKPCSGCPWRRVSAPGFFGEHPWSDYRDLALWQVPTACHKTVGDGREPAVCVGMAQFLNNAVSRPRDADYAAEVAKAGTNPEVFANLTEFEAHHREANERWLVTLTGDRRHG